MNRAPESTSRQVLEVLLQRHRETERIHYNVQHNHAPMVLIALYRLGAEAEELQRYYHGLDSTSMLEPALHPPSIDSGNWTAFWGNLDAWMSYRRFFQSEADRIGIEAVLRTYIPPLMRGVAGHAFHPLLRVSYGLDLGDPEEILSGIAYWAATFLPAPEMPQNKSSIPPGELLNNLASTPSLRAVKADNSSIARRIGQFFMNDDFRSRLQPIRIDPSRPLAELASILTDAFRDMHHFTILHGVTSCHALRAVLPYFIQPQQQISEYWHAVCAAYLSVINLSGSFHRALPENDADWTSILNDAIATGAEHTIKLAYTCFQESREYNRDIYRRFALRENEADAPFV